MSEGPVSERPLQRVTAQQAFERVRDDGHAFIDVRSEVEFMSGHPEGAYNVPWQLRMPEGLRDNPDFLQTMRRHFATDARLVIGCRSGNRSQHAARALMAAGYDAVVEQRGGFEGKRDEFGAVVDVGWKQAALPWTAEPLPGRSHEALASEG